VPLLAGTAAIALARSSAAAALASAALNRDSSTSHFCLAISAATITTCALGSRGVVGLETLPLPDRLPPPNLASSPRSRTISFLAASSSPSNPLSRARSRSSVATLSRHWSRSAARWSATLWTRLASATASTAAPQHTCPDRQSCGAGDAMLGSVLICDDLICCDVISESCRLSSSRSARSDVACCSCERRQFRNCSNTALRSQAGRNRDVASIAVVPPPCRLKDSSSARSASSRSPAPSQYSLHSANSAFVSAAPRSAVDSCS